MIVVVAVASVLVALVAAVVDELKNPIVDYSNSILDLSLPKSFHPMLDCILHLQ